MERRQKKSIQAISYLTNKSPNQQINRLKVFKLLWLSDKYHLLKFGRTILKDIYCAMENGPVPSEVFDFTKIHPDYYEEHLTTTRYFIKSVKPCDVSLLSKSDIEVLDLVWEEFGSMDVWVLRDLTHQYPEWKRFEKQLKDPNSPNSYPMILEDFYEIPVNNEKNKSNFFSTIPNGMIQESMETLKLRQKFEK